MEPHDHLVSTTFVLENAHSIYAVAKSDSNGYRRILNGNTDGRYLFGNGNGNNNFATLYGVSNWNSTGVITNSPAQSVASHSILVAVSDGTNVTPYHNGTAQNSMSSTMGGSAPAGITIGKHGTASSQYWHGHIAEIIIFNKNHSVNEREEVEGYLAQKWGLTGSLTNGHSSLIKYKDDTTSGTGKSLDLSNGISAVVKTGGTENVFDPGYTFSTSMWVKGWPAVTNQSLISKDNFSPAIFGDLKSWLDANSANSLVQDSSGTPSSNNDIVFKWKDLSGNGHHASTLDTSPKLNTTGFNNKPTVEFTNDTLELDGSEAFDWDGLTVFTVWKAPQNNTWTAFFGRTKSLNHATEATWHFMARRADQTPPKYRFRINGPSATSAPELSGTYSAQIKSNNLLVLRYNGSYQRAFLNGTSAMNIAYSGGMRPTSYKLTMGGESDGGSGPTMNVSEFIVFKGALSDANVVKIEGYLAHKWGLESNLPSGHSHKSNPPIFGGWAVERASTGNDNLALNMIGAGDEFSKSVPINDNEWHHIVTTYGGANKKIYVDGVEVATAAQTGGVTASTFKLTLGDPNLYGGSATRPRIDDVRYYSVVLTAAEVAAIYNEGENDVGAQKFSVTSPSTIQGAVGKSVSYQITTDAAYGMTGYNAAITYTLLNKPSWLSVNGSTGAVSGTPPSAGTYSFQAKATNTLGTGIKDVTITVSDYANWNYALPFTTDYAGGSALQDWNMLVRLSEGSSNGAGSAGFRYSQLSPNGGDLRFVSKAGEELKYEIANWNTAGESQVWVRVPSLASDENVTMYWGNTNAGLPAYANNGSVWDGYFGVYHLEGTTGSAVDSSPLSNNLPGVNAPVLEASGLSGTAYSSTSAANNGFISSALSGNIKAKNGTYSLWINHSPNVANKHFFGMEYNNDASNYLYVVGGTASANKARVWVAGGSTGFTGISTPTTTLSGGWQMLTLVINNGYAQVYVDGTADGSSAWYHPGLDAVSGLAIGRGTADAGPDATFDEATFSTVPRTADWLLASYNNQKPSSTYLNFGSLSGPISLDDPDYTEIYGKKDSIITAFTIGHSGSGSFSATGLSGTGLTLNSATGILSGTPLLCWHIQHHSHRHRHHCWRGHSHS